MVSNHIADTTLSSPWPQDVTCPSALNCSVFFSNVKITGLHTRSYLFVP